MRLVLFEGPGAGRGIRPGVWTEAGIVDVSSATRSLEAPTPQRLMEQIIDRFDELRPQLERLSADSPAVPVDIVRLRPPLPRPGKILCCIGNYWEHAERQPRALNMYLKNPDAVIGPGDTIVLPQLTAEPVSDGPGPYVFQHEAELGIVIKGPAKSIKQSDWRRAVFGYTGMVDVSARAEARSTWRQG